MTIRELLDNFEIQGAFIVKVWNEDTNDCAILAEGEQFEYQIWHNDNEVLDRKITYMYAVDGTLVIEVK